MVIFHSYVSFMLVYQRVYSKTARWVRKWWKKREMLGYCRYPIFRQTNTGLGESSIKKIGWKPFENNMSGRNRATKIFDSHGHSAGTNHGEFGCKHMWNRDLNHWKILKIGFDQKDSQITKVNQLVYPHSSEWTSHMLCRDRNHSYNQMPRLRTNARSWDKLKVHKFDQVGGFSTHHIFFFLSLILQWFSSFAPANNSMKMNLGTQRGSRASEQFNSGWGLFSLSLCHTKKRNLFRVFSLPQKSPVEQRKGWSTSGFQADSIRFIGNHSCRRFLTIATTLW